MDGEYLHVHRDVKHDRQGNGGRTIHLHDAVGLLPHLSNRGPLFPSLPHTEEVSRIFNRWFDKRVARAHREMRSDAWSLRKWWLYRHRHAFAAAVLRASPSGETLRRLQRHFGHGSITTTERYLAWVPPSLRGGLLRPAASCQMPGTGSGKSATPAKMEGSELVLVF